MRNFQSISIIVFLSLYSLVGCGAISGRKGLVELSKPAKQEVEFSAGEKIPEEKKENDIESKAAYHLGLGHLLWLDGEYTKALDHFKAALEIDPHSAYLNYVLGEKYFLLALPSPFTKEKIDRQIRADMYQRAEYYLENAHAIDPNDKQILEMLADIKYDLKKSKEVILLNRKLLSIDSDNMNARLHLAEELINLGDYYDVIDILKPLIEKVPEHPDANFLIGYSFYAIGKTSLAKQHLELAYKRSPYMRGLVEILGDIYKDDAEYEKAMEIYKKIAHISPKESYFYEQYVQMLMILKHYDAAIEVIRDIIDNGVENSLYYYYLGFISVAKGELEDAITSYKKAMMLNSDDYRIPYQLSNIYFDLGKYDESVTILEEALTKSPDNPWLILFLGEAYTRIQKYDEALTIYDKGVSLVQLGDDKIPLPKDIDFYMHKAIVYEQIGSYEESEKMLLKILDLDWNNAEALNFLGFMYAEMGIKLGKAEKYLLKALTMEPQNGAYLDSLGWVYYKQKRYSDALKNLKKASQQLNNSDPVILDHIGDTLFALGCFESAVKVWQKALSLDQDNETIMKKAEQNSGRQNVLDQECKLDTFLTNPPNSQDQKQMQSLDQPQ